MTLLELLISMVLIGLVGGLIVGFLLKQQRFYAGTNEILLTRTQVRQAAAMLPSDLRAIAIQRSRQSWLVRSGNTLKVLGDSAGVKVQLGRTVDLFTRNGVTLSSASTPPGRDTVSFDPRGILFGTTTAYKLIIAKGGKADTLCVSGIGNTRARGC